MKKNSRAADWITLGFLTAAFFVLAANTPWWETALRVLFPSESQVVHPRSDILTLVLEHLWLVGVSSGLTIMLSVPLGVWVTRPGGREFLPIVAAVTSFGQTFPPVAVLALAVPLMGFGFLPTVMALFLYGILPVVRNTIAGLDAVSPEILNAAYGMGMSRRQALFMVEIPLAARLIIAGIRISVIINIGTAMVGAVIGAGGLGSPIVAGLVQGNTAFILEGAVPAALLALLADRFLAQVERLYVAV